MTLLEEIQNSAVDPGCDLGTILRKCKVLAARLGSRQLEDWILFESNGYSKEAEIPPYRKWPITIKGNFSGPFGSGAQNIPIPSMVIPEKFREVYTVYKCTLSISSIESTIKENKGGPLSLSLGDLSVILGGNVFEAQHCYAAWGEFGVGHFIEVINIVRNKVLDFCLALWKEDPRAGEIGERTTEPIQTQEITQIFHTTVSDGGKIEYLGSSHSGSNIEINVERNNFESLSDVLRKNGVSMEDIEELRRVLESDEKPSQPGRFGAGVSAWIGKMVGKAASGTWNIAAGTAGGFLSQVLIKYFGLG